MPCLGRQAWLRAGSSTPRSSRPCVCEWVRKAASFDRYKPSQASDAARRRGDPADTRGADRVREDGCATLPLPG